MILNVSVLCAILFKSSLAEKYWKAMIVLVPLFFFKMGQPRPLFHLFSSFQTCITNFTNFTTNRYVKKCPSSIQCRDSNSQPLEHESPPITTRPGLLPMSTIVSKGRKFGRLASGILPINCCSPFKHIISQYMNLLLTFQT